MSSIGIATLGLFEQSNTGKVIASGGGVRTVTEEKPKPKIKIMSIKTQEEKFKRQIEIMSIKSGDTIYD